MNTQMQPDAPGPVGTMTAKVCLRCDWLGETTVRACPNCGVPLYVVEGPAQEPAEPKAHGDPGGPGDPGEPKDEAEPSIGPPLNSASRSDARGTPTRATFTRAAGAFVVGALLLTVAFDAWLTSDEVRSSPSTPTRTTIGDSLVRLATHPASPTAGGVGPIEKLSGWNSCSSRCRRELTVGGMPFSFRVPARGWEAFGDISINKSIVGPQDAEAIIYWTTIPGDHANPCVDVLGMPVPRTVGKLTAEMADAPGTELLAGPSNVNVGGRRGKSLALVVRQDVGCDPGHFFIWHDMEAGALWPATEVGDTLSMWVVDSRETPIVIAALTSEQATRGLQLEIGKIVGSIRFGPRPSS
jgi:hypothetical protein